MLGCELGPCRSIFHERPLHLRGAQELPGQVQCSNEMPQVFRRVTIWGEAFWMVE